MRNSGVLVLSALTVALLAVLGAEAKFTLQAEDGVARRQLIDGFTIGQEAHSVPPPAGHHPPGTGRHPPGSGHHPPGVGHHGPDRFGRIPGHHPRGVGHRGGRGHHPPGTGQKSCALYPSRCTEGTNALLQTPTCCSKSCHNLLNETAHCGACGNICAALSLCCGGVCTDVQIDSSNCGACGVACGGGATCNFGQCGYGSAPTPA